jgi:hypothetical protein
MIHSVSDIGFPSQIPADEFETEVAELRKQFTGEGNTETFFKQEYHKGIPADG